MFDVEKPAGTSSTALRFVERPAPGLAYVGDRGVFRADQLPKVATACEAL